MLKLDEISEEQFLAYDIETDSVFPAYCGLQMVSCQLGLGGEPQLVNLQDEVERKRLRRLLRDPEIIKVSYNGINFDDIVLMRHGFYVEPHGRHDMFLALKTVAPSLPSFGLKFANWRWFGDWHEPERRLGAWLLHHGMKKKSQMYQAPIDRLGAYCKHDVEETVKIFRLIWEVVQRPEHWKVYRTMELAMADPLHEMVMLAGEWLDPDDITDKIGKLEAERKGIIKKVATLSKGKITNAASALQVSSYLHDIDQVDLELSKAGHYSATKEDLIELMPTNPIAKYVYEIRDISKVIEHYRCHLHAAAYERERRINGNGQGQNGHPPALDCQLSLSKAGYRFGPNQNNGIDCEVIPKGYTVSSARTRRFQSSSRFGINFQNQNKRTKLVQLVPKGWFGCWIDSRQIENVVHIWASQDEVRRTAYEADPDWNEYVWLTNTVLGGNKSRKELEATPSDLNPNISMYKQYKQIKLALNFFMGLTKFAKKAGLTQAQAARLFGQVHEACPAIRNIGRILREELKAEGRVRDPFGHIYSGSLKDINRVTMYLIQGCGTGSAPKAMTIANYKTLHSLDSDKPLYYPCFYHRFRRRYAYGLVCGSTHDECAFRISLGLEEERIVKLIKACLFNMEGRFSPLFDHIPLRAQLAVSLTNASEQTELDHRQSDFEERLIEEWIRPGKVQHEH